MSPSSAAGALLTPSPCVKCRWALSVPWPCVKCRWALSVPWPRVKSGVRRCRSDIDVPKSLKEPAHRYIDADGSADPESALHVGELLRYLAVADGDHVDAPHMAADPVVPPALYHPLARDERVLHGEVARHVLEDGFPCGPDCRVADMALTVRRG